MKQAHGLSHQVHGEQVSTAQRGVSAHHHLHRERRFARYLPHPVFLHSIFACLLAQLDTPFYGSGRAQQMKFVIYSFPESTGDFLAAGLIATYFGQARGAAVMAPTSRQQTTDRSSLSWEMTSSRKTRRKRLVLLRRTWLCFRRAEGISWRVLGRDERTHCNFVLSKDEAST
ncbi:hypothetical protein BD289DRAFT_443046, partial [Coniella lustricola]